MNMDLEKLKELWKKVLLKAKKFIQPEVFFDEHIKNLTPKIFRNNIIYVVPNSAFARSVLNDPQYIDQFNKAVQEISGEEYTIQFVSKSELIAKNMEKEKKITNANSGLNKNMYFSNFIVGESNKQAFNAAKAIASEKNLKWNPLFLYGSTGLGKTHLINAIGNEFSKNFPEKKVICTNIDDFTREVFAAISNSKVEEFKNKIKMSDLLILDDVQFLATREKTNEIFFDIFNNMVKDQKWIVMTSDKKPDQLRDFDERMISRFSSGLSVEITKPDSSTVCEILTLKLQEADCTFKMTEKAIAKIINLFNTDIRKLEGVLNRIVFYVMSNYENLTLLDEEHIDKILESEYRTITTELNKNPEGIIEIICRNYNVSKSGVLSESRKSELTNVRKICMYVLKHKLKMTLAEIGKTFQRDHSTVKSSIDGVEKMMLKDSSLRQFIESMISKL